MERDEMLKKIKSGTIRIQEDRLTGLGVDENESIDIEKLTDLLMLYSTDGLVEHSTNLAISLGQIASLACQGTIRPDDLKEMIPGPDGIYFLKMIVETFKPKSCV